MIHKRMNINDIGQEKFRSMVRMYYRQANSCMIVYDITSRASFESVESWYNKIIEENTEEDNEICLFYLINEWMILMFL